jgi:hypothetical protein
MSGQGRRIAEVMRAQSFLFTEQLSPLMNCRFQFHSLALVFLFEKFASPITSLASIARCSSILRQFDPRDVFFQIFFQELILLDMSWITYAEERFPNSNPFSFTVWDIVEWPFLKYFLGKALFYKFGSGFSSATNSFVLLQIRRNIDLALPVLPLLV